MNHHHVGPPDYACDGCIGEAVDIDQRKQRRKTVAGVLLLIVLVIGSMALLSWYLNRS